MALVLAEGLTRWLAPQRLYESPPGLFVPHSTRTYALAPSFRGYLRTREFEMEIATNELGLREDRPLGTKPSGTFRILVLGDSFTLGVGVAAEETFVRRLEHALDQGGARVEVINAGVPSYSTGEETLYLEEEGLRLDPDLVLLGLFVGNDVVDNAGRRRWRVVDGELVDGATRPLLPFWLRRALARHSHLYHFALPLRRSLVDLNTGDFRREVAFAVFEEPGSPRAAPLWAATERRLRRLLAVTQAHGIPVAVVLIPQRAQVEADAWHAVEVATGRDGERWAADRPNAHLTRLLARLAVPVLDTLPPLRRVATRAPLFFPLDGHLTVAGHAIVGRLLADFVRAERLVPAPVLLTPATYRP